MQYFLYALKNMFKVGGRASRPEYWWTTFYINFVPISLLLLGWATIFLLPDVGAGIIIGSWGFIALSVIISWLIGIRRLHDINRSGWFMLFAFLPIANIYLLFLLIQQGDLKENKYGKVPVKVSSNKAAMKQTGLVLVALFAILGACFYFLSVNDSSDNYNGSELDSFIDTYGKESFEEMGFTPGIPLSEFYKYSDTYPDEIKTILEDAFGQEIEFYIVAEYVEGSEYMHVFPRDGIAISNVDYSLAEEKLVEVQQKLAGTGYHAFLTREKYDYDNDQYVIDFVITRADSQFYIIELVGMNGANSAITTAEIREQLEAIYEMAPFQIVSVETDSLIANFTEELPVDMRPFAEAVYALNPETVDIGFESLDEYIDYTRKDNQLSLWWD
jgi:uncharacterized membrane protein YhaH (DUF805 family)